MWQFNNPRGATEETTEAAEAAAAPAVVEDGADDEEAEGEEDQEEGGGWEAPRTNSLGTAKVDGVRKFNTGVALNPLFEILRASPQGQLALNEKGPDRSGTGVEHVPVRGFCVPVGPAERYGWSVALKRRIFKATTHTLLQIYIRSQTDRRPGGRRDHRAVGPDALPG